MIYQRFRVLDDNLAIRRNARNVLIMGALAIVDRLLRGNFELGIKITLGFFPMRS